MKKNLGKVFIIIFFFLTINVSASEYEWSAFSSKKEAFINEGIYLKYTCKFSDRGELYTIDFNPLSDNENYTIELLKKSENFVDGKRVSSFEYVAFAKKSGELVLNFDVGMKSTTQEFINDSTKSRDDDRGDDDFSQKFIRQKTLSVNIKDTAEKIVGNFSFKVIKDENVVKAYQPYHLDIEILGEGDFRFFKPLEFKLDGVKVFSQKPVIDIKLTQDSYRGVWKQKFAFVSEQDFKIPIIKIKYFDLESQSMKFFEQDSIDVTVLKGFKKTELLDEVDEEKPLSFEFVYYILTFLAGFLIAKIKFKIKQVDSKNEMLIKKIKNVKSLNELSILLILEDRRKFNAIILKIETNELNSLSDTRNKVIQLI